MKPMLDQTSGDSIHRMTCMEVWGGNRAVDTAVSVPGLDAWIFASPWHAAEAGGDLHYMSMCAAGRIARFVVADVSGHGDSVDEIAKTLRRFMRKHINTIDQSRFTRHLNRAFTSAESGRFATAALASYHAPSQHLVISNAGHPRPLLFRETTNEWSLLDETSNGAITRPNSDQNSGGLPSNLPLGVIEPTEYHQFAVPFGVGDRLVMYTDALIEAQSKDGGMLGERGLLKLVSELKNTPDKEFRVLLVDSVLGQSPEQPDDDVTVLTLRGAGSSSRTIPLGERLHAIRRLVLE